MSLLSPSGIGLTQVVCRGALLWKEMNALLAQVVSCYVDDNPRKHYAPHAWQHSKLG